MADKTISKAVISRLPRYYRYLGDLNRAGVERISSNELADLMNVTPSQIRQDFNTFGGFGQQGYGYNVQFLREEIGKILGVDHDHKMVVVGAGNLAHALTNYSGFNNIGFYIVGLFDTNPERIGKKYNGLEIRSMDELKGFVEKENIDLGILAVPVASANEAAAAMIEAGVKNIWNFVPTDLKIDISSDTIIQNEHLADGLLQLSYTITAANESCRK